REATPRPTVSVEWLDQQLRDSRRDDRRARAAATTLHANSRYVEQFLDPGAQRGLERTDNQKNTTIAVFNALYQIPAFRLYLSSVAAQQQALPEAQRSFPEFLALQTFLAEPGRGETLSSGAEDAIIRGADMYIRYFLFSFVAGNADYARFREELNQLPTGRWRVENVQGAMTFQPQGGRAPSEADRIALMRLYLTGTMDADTITVASLYLRRWTLEHPERGRGRRQDQIDAWQAPEIITPTEVAAQAVVPRVGVIGDSLTAGGRYATTLRTYLREGNPDAAVDHYGVVGESLRAISGRFERDILSHAPAYNAVVIQGGINGITGTSVIEAERYFTQMISAARARGMKVILLTLHPWAGASSSDATAQSRTAEINTWLRSQAQADGSVVVVDVSSLGEGNPPRLRQIYDSGDHLHPNADGRDLIARLISQAAFGRQPTATQARSELQDYADRNWRNLSTELSNAARQGRPEAIITLSRNLPQGQASLEAALTALNRDDIARAYDRVFNDYFHRDRDFLDFCRTRTEYQSIALESVTMSAQRTPAERRAVVRAMQEFINYQAGRSGDEYYTRLRDDLRLLYRDGLRLTGDSQQSLHIDGMEDVRTLAAIGVYSWRKANRSAQVGAWGQSLGIGTQRTEAQPAQPAQPTQPEPRPGEQRRRVIHP
ncbi:MAG: GDSL-type esterase/lipase family protein, partial [Candidatus Micrarchaeota archaeon]